MDNEQQLLKTTFTYVKYLLSNDSSGHDGQHVIRVYTNAMKIMNKEGGDQFIIALASLLHDVDDHKLFPNNTNYENARNFMNSIELDKDIQEKIIHIISQVSYKGKDSVKPDTLEGMIVQDADRLDAIGAIGIARTFAYGGSKGRKIYDLSDKPNPNKAFEEYKNGNLSSLSHFYEKLLLLKDMMNTNTAKKIAEERHRFLESFLQELYKEIDA